MANWTDDQLEAIRSRGKICLSRPRRAGKTAVLVERIIRMVVEDGVGIEHELMIVTTIMPPPER